MTWRDLILCVLALGLLACAGLMLSACAHQTPPTILPVAVSCVPAEMSAKPDAHTPEAIAKAPNGPDRYAMLWRDYLRLFGWSLSAEPVIDGCRKAGDTPTT